MPLNYSKWDQLELSDDSDIEGHPNVDKKSLIRWKQRDIHEKRDQRKARIAQLRADMSCEEVILPRLKAIAKEVEEGGRAHFSALVERLTSQPSPEAPPGDIDGQPTYDAILKTHLLKVYEDIKEKGVEKDDPKLDQALVDGLHGHISEVTSFQVKRRKELQKLEEEQAKKITSEDIHEGFQSKYVPPKPAPPPVQPQKSKKTKVTKETTLETLNPEAAIADTSTSQDQVKEDGAEDEAEDEEEDEDDEDALPELTPALLEFSKLPLKEYEKSWEFIKNNRAVVVKGATDALLVAAFAAERQGEKKYALQCVHQGLLLQYCDKLGPDGVRLFFQRMVSGDKRAEPVFLQDVQQTYTHLASRVAATQAEEAQSTGREQIQLMQEDPSQPITFNVPDGPPPEELRLEGPGTENLDIDQVRRALQMRWDVFQSFDESLRKALRKGTLEAVNKVLGKLEVQDAEETVKMLEMAGILSFADGGKVRDLTQPDEGEAGEEEDDDSGEGDKGAADKSETS